MAVRNGLLESLEQRRPTLFFLGAAMFVVAAAFNGIQLVAGTERLTATVGQAFISGGWLVGLLGLLGLYPGLANRSHWLSRAGAAFAVIGLLAFTVMAVASLYAFVAGNEPGNFPIPIVYIIPGVLAGSILAFVFVSGAALQSDDFPQTLSLFLLVPSAIVVTNFFILPAIYGWETLPPNVGVVIITGLALSMLAIGYLLRTEPEPIDHPEAAPAEVQQD